MTSSEDEDVIRRLFEIQDEFGMLQFNDRIEMLSLNPRFKKIGNFELDIIAIIRSTGQIVMLDHDDPDFIMGECAIDIRSFLRAISYYITFIESPEYDWDNISELQKTVDRMSFISGSQDHKWFYNMMFGI